MALFLWSTQVLLWSELCYEIMLEKTHLTQVSIKLLWLFTYLLPNAKSLKWAYRELQKVKFVSSSKMEKKARSSLILILANSRQCNSYTRLDYTRLDYTTCGYVLGFGFSSVIAQLVVMALFMKHSELCHEIMLEKKNLTKLVIVSYQWTKSSYTG